MSVSQKYNIVCMYACVAAFSGSGPQIALGLRKLCPAKRAWSPNSSSILRGRGGVRAGRGNVNKDDSKQTERKEERDHHCHKLFKITLYWHEIRAENTHLMSWLYLARRSDRQGAPVFIWRDKNTTDHEELQYIFYLLYYHDILALSWVQHPFWGNYPFRAFRIVNNHKTP